MHGHISREFPDKLRATGKGKSTDKPLTTKINAKCTGILMGKMGIGIRKAY